MRVHETENIPMAEKKVIVIPDGKICDYIDGKQRNDTPEEYVRQTIENRLVNEHKYSPGQIKIEYTLHVGANKPRADIVIWEKEDDEKTQANVKLIIECKKRNRRCAQYERRHSTAPVVHVRVPQLRLGHVDQQCPKVCLSQSR